MSVNDYLSALSSLQADREIVQRRHHALYAPCPEKMEPLCVSGVVVFQLVSGRAIVISSTAFNSDIVFLQ